MKLKQFCMFLLIILLLLSPLSFASEGDYKIPSVIKDITINDDGSTVISEEIVYDIEGSVNGVYRDIPLTANQSVENISVETPGYYNKLEINRYSDSVQMKVWLYKDAAKTQKTNDAKVAVKYKYTLRKGVKIYNDVVDFQYMTWDEDWKTNVDYLESQIHIPGSKDNVEYYNNPDDNVVSSEWTSNDTLTTKVDNIPAHKRFEQRILMPKSYLKKSTYAQVIDLDAKDLIKQDQEDYHKKIGYDYDAQNIYLAIICLVFATPIAVYARYGREPKISYDAKYEYDIPTDATPVQVNSIVKSAVGSPDNNAIIATILDLIDRKYFRIVSYEYNNTIIARTQRDVSDLKEYEITLINFLSQYAVDGNISIDSIGRPYNRRDFQDFRNVWMQQAKNEVPDSMIKQYFDDKGNKLLKILSVLIILFPILTILSVSFINIPGSVLLMAFLMIPVSIIEAGILHYLPKTLVGRWTPEGKEFHDKWKNFEKYINDYSLIRERPPASVEVWGRYLVYAAAMGCADRTTMNMKQYFNSSDMRGDFSDSYAVSFAYYGGFKQVESSVVTLSRFENNDSLGIGSSGSGGFGGGGGGTF